MVVERRAPLHLREFCPKMAVVDIVLGFSCHGFLFNKHSCNTPTQLELLLSRLVAQVTRSDYAHSRQLANRNIT